VILLNKLSFISNAYVSFNRLFFYKVISIIDQLTLEFYVLFRCETWQTVINFFFFDNRLFLYDHWLNFLWLFGFSYTFFHQRRLLTFKFNISTGFSIWVFDVIALNFVIKLAVTGFVLPNLLNYKFKWRKLCLPFSMIHSVFPILNQLILKDLWAAILHTIQQKKIELTRMFISQDWTSIIVEKHVCSEWSLELVSILVFKRCFFVFFLFVWFFILIFGRLSLSITIRTLNRFGYWWASNIKWLTLSLFFCSFRLMFCSTFI